MSPSDYKEFDKSHHLLFHQLQTLPDSTAILAIYLRPGILPLTAVLVRQLAMKDTSLTSWTLQLGMVLYKYNKTSPIQLANNPHDKEKNGKVLSIEFSGTTWDQSLKEDAVYIKSIKFLLNMYSMWYSHLMWVCRN